MNDNPCPQCGKGCSSCYNAGRSWNHQDVSAVREALNFYILRDETHAQSPPVFVHQALHTLARLDASTTAISEVGKQPEVASSGGRRPFKLIHFAAGSPLFAQPWGSYKTAENAWKSLEAHLSDAAKRRVTFWSSGWFVLRDGDGVIEVRGVGSCEGKEMPVVTVYDRSKK